MQAAIGKKMAGQVAGQLQQQAANVISQGAEMVAPGYDPLSQALQGPGLTVKQTMKGCSRECLGCEDSSEYRISDFAGAEEPVSAPILYGQQDTDGAMRCCICNALGIDGARRIKMEISQFNPQDIIDGDYARGRGGTKLASYTKPCSCPVCLRLPIGWGVGFYIPLFTCCFFLPEVQAKNALGAQVGHTKYVCDSFLCVPKWKVYDRNGQMTYLVRPDTCFMGCCVKCDKTAGGRGCIHQEMILRDPTTLSPIYATTGHDAKYAMVSKAFSGTNEECLTNNYCVRYPPGIDAAMKANLLGLAHLIDFTFYEGNKL
eukprot:Hpha_TRINITY_DN8030_c0_g2::TRINITY_DN8030_c0_g2_i1::g.140093::m.140093